MDSGLRAEMPSLLCSSLLISICSSLFGAVLPIMDSGNGEEPIADEFLDNLFWVIDCLCILPVSCQGRHCLGKQTHKVLVLLYKI